MNTRYLLVLLAATCAAPTGAAAQGATAGPARSEAPVRFGVADRFSVELAAEANVPTHDLGPSDLGTGVGLELVAGYRFMPHLSAYAGWGWRRFEADGFLAGSDVDAEETGYTFGLRFAHPLGSTPLGYFVEAGGLYDHVEFEERGDVVMDTGHGLGWQVGAGLVVPLGSRWLLVPGVRYHSLSRDLSVAGERVDLQLSYVTARAGIARTF